MKKLFFLLSLSLIFSFFLDVSSCKKDDVSSPSNQPPVLSTLDVTNITQTTATSGGNITSDGGATVTARGVCWSVGITPTLSDNKSIDGAGGGNFTSNLSGLIPNTIYYVRAYATNSAGTGYGMAMSFTTKKEIKDIDGNVYHTVTIGTQVWMVENLKTTRYRNGEKITNVTDNLTWSNLTGGAYCNYLNDSNYSSVYGRLYNWYAVNDSRNLAPEGWHIPTDDEWTTLTNYLGGESIAGGKLKEAGFTHWSNPNTGATNESGFSALPGGYRLLNGTFLTMAEVGFWWSSNENGNDEAWMRQLHNLYNHIGKLSYNKKLGFSIRCLKD